MASITNSRNPSVVSEPDLDKTTINLHECHDRSIPMAILQHLVKPFRPRLVKPPKNQPAYEGSPKLTAHPSILFKVSVKESEIQNVYVYELVPNLGMTGIKYRPKHDLYYFAGGGFSMPASKEHWKFCSELAQQLPEYRIHLVSYPLAPHNTASKSLPILHAFIEDLCQKADKPNRSITLMGDSSGGNIALTLGLHITNQTHHSDSPRRTQLKNILLISPPMDLRNTNPAIPPTNAHDPVLTKQHVQSVADQWTDAHLPASSPLVSPVLADLSSLRTLGVKVHGILGLYDVLAPDAICFRQRLEHHRVAGEWLQWDKQMHCFPLAYMYPFLPEARKGKDWILRVLRDHA